MDRKKAGDGLGAYVRRVREDTQRYGQELLAENEELRRVVAALEADKARLDERLRDGDELRRTCDALRTLQAAAEQEKARLQAQLVEARREIDLHKQESRLLEGRLRGVEEASRRSAQQFAEAEAQNNNLANLYVASYRLHSTLDRDEVLAAIQEIVANLIGSEESAVFELDPGRGALELVSSFGVEPGALRGVAWGAGLIGASAARGERYVRGEQPADGALPHERDLSACIPLVLDGRPIGVIALFRLLPQKSTFVAIDSELFDLLGTHAATALYCSRLRARDTQGQA